MDHQSGVEVMVSRTAARILESDHSVEEKILKIREHADTLVEDHSMPITDRLPALRVHAKDWGIILRDNELERYLRDARRKAAGVPDLVTSDDVLDMSQPVWICEGIIMKSACNLLIAAPKVGKTSWFLGLISALHRGEDSFVGFPLTAECPPVLIIGTDQPESDWGRMLHKAGLVTLDEQGNGRLCDPPIIGLAHSGCPWHLDEEGIQKIAQKAEAHPDLLILVDSLHACCRPLGINESSVELADPVIELMEAVGPYDATVVVIHHASKGRGSDSASMLSRGSTALPAAASQIISLKRLDENASSPTGNPIMLRTEGRASARTEQLILQMPDGSWVHDDIAAAVQERQRLIDAESQLTERGRTTLGVLRDLFNQTGERVSVAQINAVLQLGGSDPGKLIRRELDRMIWKGLVLMEKGFINNNEVNMYMPVILPEDQGALVTDSL